MNIARLLMALCTIAAAAAPSPATATAVAGPAGAAEPGRRVGVAAPAVRDARTVELIPAVIDAAQVERGLLVLHGKPVALHPTQLRVLRGGQGATAASLQAGQAIRFALEPDVGQPRRIILIHIDR